MSESIHPKKAACPRTRKEGPGIIRRKLAQVATQHLARIRRERPEVMLSLIHFGTLEGGFDALAFCLVSLLEEALPFGLTS